MEPRVRNSIFITSKNGTPGRSFSSSSWQTIRAAQHQCFQWLAERIAIVCHENRGIGKAKLEVLILAFLGLTALAAQISLPRALPQEAKKVENITLKDGKVVVQSSLKTDDAADKAQKQPCKVFSVVLKAGRNYKIDMASKEIDSYLRLEDATGKELAKDDDSGGLVNARINFQCRKDGAHRVICTTFAGGTGPFTLTIQEIALAKPVELTPKDGMAKVEAKLTSMDEADAVRTRSVCKIYAIKLAKGKSYQIDMMSKDVDSYLRLEDAARKELAKDDDSGGNRNARIRFDCPVDGEYRIIATTYLGGTGSFTVSVKEK